MGKVLGDNPFGSEPETTVQVYGGVPPVALSVCEYCDPATPAGNGPVVIVICWAETS